MYRFSTYRSQYAANIRLALPIVLTQIGLILTQLADNLMVGQYGGEDPVPLAAIAFGGAVSFIFFITAIGMATGLTPLVGELFARGEHRESARLLQNGILFYTLLGVATTLLHLLFIPLLYRLGQPVEVVDAALPYYRLLAWSMPFILLFFAFKQFLEGVGNTHAELIVTAIANIANIGLNWLFIYGRWGCPELGATGAGLATLLARILTPILAIGYFCTRARYRSYLAGFSLRSWSRERVRKLVRIGVPIASQMFLETSAFIGTSLMMGWLGTVAIGANQIAITINNCAWMISSSVSAATTIRIAHCYGARNIGEMKVAARAAWHLIIGWALFMTILFVALRNVLPQLFTANGEVIGLTAELLLFVALFQLSDGVQNISVGILRGMQDVRIIMPIAGIAYWVLNLPVGYFFGFTLGMGPSGLFLGYSVGLTAAAVLLILRIRQTVRRLS